MKFLNTRPQPKHEKDSSGMIVGDYVAFPHLMDGDVSEMTRKDARDSFNHFMAHKDNQLLQLKALLKLNGMALSGKSEDIGQINRWIIETICYSPDEFYFDEDDAKRYYIHPMWSNVLFDLSIYISELVIQNTKNVEWHFNSTVPKNEISYQQPVLTGFSKITEKHYYQNFGLSLFNFAMDCLEDRSEAPDEFFNFILEDAILEDVDLKETMFEHDDFAKSIGLD